MRNSPQNKKFSVKNLAVIGVLAALVFVSLNVSFPIPLVPGTAPTRIHIGNAVILLAGFLLGGKRGGIAAGLGAFLFDLVHPAYVSSAVNTLVTRFLMAYICGTIAHMKSKEGESFGYNLFGAVTGSVFYMIAYLTKKFLEVLTAQEGFWKAASYVISGQLQTASGLNTALSATGTSAIASSINAVFGVTASVALCAVIKKAMIKAHVTL